MHSSTRACTPVWCVCVRLNALARVCTRACACVLAYVYACVHVHMRALLCVCVFYLSQAIKYSNGTFRVTTHKDMRIGEHFKNGTCSFSSTLFMVRGVFTFSVHFIPGSPVHVATLHIGNGQW